MLFFTCVSSRVPSGNYRIWCALRDNIFFEFKHQLEAHYWFTAERKCFKLKFDNINRWKFVWVSHWKFYMLRTFRFQNDTCVSLCLCSYLKRVFSLKYAFSVFVFVCTQFPSSSAVLTLRVYFLSGFAWIILKCIFRESVKYAAACACVSGQCIVSCVAESTLNGNFCCPMCGRDRKIAIFC